MLLVTILYNTCYYILLDDALGLISMYAPVSPQIVTVHRCTVRKDLIDVFSDANIMNSSLDVVMIDARGEPELGKGKGAVLDMLTNFWHECFISLTVGRRQKTPFIRHDKQKREWEAIARILVYGFQKYSYFPLQLSTLFLLSCLFGEESITPEFLLASFKDYIPAEDQEVLDECLGDSFEENNQDLVDFLSSFKCFRIHTKENIVEIIHELAHQELIQKPRYIVNCWAPILSKLQQQHQDFQSIESVQEFYKSKSPTAKKIIRLFRADPLSDADRQSLDHLKRFVKSLEGSALSKFLHFCTGSDIITCDYITITFNSLSGLERRPVARTCVPLIELPSTYESYLTLAEELSNILRHELAWSFDIV